MDFSNGIQLKEDVSMDIFLDNICNRVGALEGNSSTGPDSGRSSKPKVSIVKTFTL